MSASGVLNVREIWSSGVGPVGRAAKVGNWNISHEEGLRELSLFSLEKRGNLSSVCQYEGRCQRMDQTLLSGARQWNRRQWAETNAWEGPPEHEEEIYIHTGTCCHIPLRDTAGSSF